MKETQDMENCSVHFNLIFSKTMVYQKAMVLISYAAIPWMKKGIFSSFFPALESLLLDVM